MRGTTLRGISSMKFLEAVTGHGINPMQRDSLLAKATPIPAIPND